MVLTPEDYQRVSLIVEAREQKYLHVETIRQLAGTEENYRVIIREINRVETQLARARRRHVAATLTVMEWFAILDRYDWLCAYCCDKPFQSMYHIISQAEAGTTAANCVPACHSCRAKPNKLVKLK